MNQLTGFLDINRYADGDKVIRPSLEAKVKGEISIEDAFDSKIQELEADKQAAKRLRNMKALKNANKRLGELQLNETRLLKVISGNTLIKNINNLDVIRETLETAANEKWWIESNLGKGAASRNFYRDISAVITDSIGKKNNKWNDFRTLGAKKGVSTGSEYNKLIKYTPEVAERAVVFNDNIFKTVVQSLDDVKDLDLEKIPQGSTSRFAKISALTGMRPENLAELSLKDIDFKDGTVSYIDKQGKRATVNVNKTSLALFQQQIDANIAHGVGGSRTVFVGTANQYSKPINKHFKNIGAYVQEADGSVKKFQLYDFRRLQKARLMANKQPQWVIDALMGHSYKGSYAKGIMEQSFTNADVRKIVIDSEVDFYNRAGYSGDAIRQFSGSDVETHPRVRVKVKGIKDPPDIPKDPPTTGGTTSTKQVVKKPVKNLAKKWGGRFLKYILPSLLSPQALTAEIVLQSSSTGKTIDEQINDLMTQNNVSKSEAIELFKENPPLEAAEGVYGIDPYEEQFKKQQEASEQEKRVQENIKEISTKGLFKADITLPEEIRLSE